MAEGQRERIFILNNPHSMRINGDLACEIGLNESVFFLQLEFLLTLVDRECHKDPKMLNKHFRDGRLWAYNSLDQLRERYFPWWSISTLHRIIKNLVEKNLVIVGNYNERKYDRTQWLTINFEEAARLKSIEVARVMPDGEPGGEEEEESETGDDSEADPVSDCKMHFSKCKMDFSDCNMDISDCNMDISDCNMHPVNLQNAFCQNETTIQETPEETPKRLQRDSSTDDEIEKQQHHLQTPQNADDDAFCAKSTNHDKPETPGEAEEIAPMPEGPGLTTPAEADGWLAELQKAKRNRNRVSILGAMQRELLGEKPDRRRLQELAMTAGGDLEGAMVVARAMLETAAEGGGLDDVEARLGHTDDRAELRAVLERAGVDEGTVMEELLGDESLTPARALAYILYAQTREGIDAPVAFAISLMRKGAAPHPAYLLLAELDGETRALFLNALDALKTGSVLPIDGQLADRFVEFARMHGHSHADVRRELRLASGAGDGPGVRPPPRPEMTPAEKSWAEAQSLLKGQMGQTAFDTYIRGTAPMSLENGTFVLAAPNAEAKEWLENRLHEMVSRAVCQVLGREVDVEFVVEAEVAT